MRDGPCGFGPAADFCAAKQTQEGDCDHRSSRRLGTTEASRSTRRISQAHPPLPQLVGRDHGQAGESGQPDFGRFRHGADESLRFGRVWRRTSLPPNCVILVLAIDLPAPVSGSSLVDIRHGLCMNRMLGGAVSTIRNGIETGRFVKGFPDGYLQPRRSNIRIFIAVIVRIVHKAIVNISDLKTRVGRRKIRRIISRGYSGRRMGEAYGGGLVTGLGIVRQVHAITDKTGRVVIRPGPGKRNQKFARRGTNVTPAQTTKGVNTNSGSEKPSIGVAFNLAHIIVRQSINNNLRLRNNPGEI